MFFILSKILYVLLLPLSWITLAFVGSFAVRHPLWKRRLRITGLVLLLTFSNGYLSNLGLAMLETSPATSISSVRTAVVLSGVMETGISVHDQYQLNAASERVTEAVRLYHAGTIQKICISGGAASIHFPDENEGELLHELILSMGVSQDDLILENESRNTHENALYSRKLLGAERQPILLITSAFHMMRAKKCFEKQGLTVTSYPVDFRAQTDFQWTDLLPTSKAFEDWNLVIKELIGIMVYKLMGYI